MRILVILLFLVVPAFSSSGEFYRAAVVEYSPLMDLRSHLNRSAAINVMLENIKKYESFVSQAKSQGATVIVFPEYGLTGPVFKERSDVFPFLEEIPDPKVLPINPCTSPLNQNNITIFTLSCLARKYQIVLVVDMADKVPIKGSTWLQFNTQVAFDSDGSLLAKYHKENLYYEAPFFDQPTGQPPVTFKTSTGLLFGMGICFDILFPNPMRELVKRGIKNFVYSTWWVNTPPFVDGLAMQRAWSLTHKVNLLASGSGHSWFNSGSGIYHNGNPLQYFYNPTTKQQDKLLIADVPINQDPTTSKVIRDTATKFQNFDDAPATSVVILNSTGTAQASVDTVSCSVSFQLLDNPDNHTYALVAIGGKKFWNVVDLPGCGIFLCPTPNNCGIQQRHALTATASFRDVVLNVTFTNPNMIIYPMVIERDGASFFNDWKFREDVGRQHMYQLLAKKDFQCQGFALFGRDTEQLY